jgi:hypothetical protein
VAQHWDTLRAIVRQEGLGEMALGAGVPMRYVIRNVTQELGYAKYDFTGLYGSVPDNLTALQVYPWQVMDEFARGIRLTQATQAALPFVANAMSGWDARPWGGEQRPVFVFPTPQEWVATLTQLRTDVASLPMGLPTRDGAGIVPALSIYSWNEFGEGGVMAPSHGWNYTRLEGLAQVFPRV